MTHELLPAVGLVGAAYLAAAAAWPARALERWGRAAVLGLVGAVTFSLPLLYPFESVFLRFATSLLCPVAGAKLLNLAVEAEWWRGRRRRDWLRFVFLIYLLVPRLHEQAPGRERSFRPLIVGAVETAAGAGLFWWAFHADLGRWSFWLDHSVKLLAAALCFFDGMFVLQTGVIRLMGIRTLDLSQGPWRSATPAEFWRRYNCEAGRLLREDVYRPLIPRTGRIAAIATAFAVNGLLHEYLAWLMVGRVQGYQLGFFALQAAAVAATWTWKPQGAMKAVAAAGTLAFVVLSTVLFFGTVQQRVPWYSRGGLLP